MYNWRARSHHSVYDDRPGALEDGLGERRMRGLRYAARRCRTRFMATSTLGLASRAHFWPDRPGQRGPGRNGVAAVMGLSPWYLWCLWLWRSVAESAHRRGSL